MEQEVKKEEEEQQQQQQQLDKMWEINKANWNPS